MLSDEILGHVPRSSLPEDFNPVLVSRRLRWTVSELNEHREVLPLDIVATILSKQTVSDVMIHDIVRELQHDERMDHCHI